MTGNNEPDISNAQTAEQLFPDYREEIRQLRGADPVFDEICSDFEEVAAMAQDDESTDGAIAESLTGLRDEIRRALLRRPCQT